MQHLINLNRPILITGESGTGKSKLAREIFNQSIIFKDKFLVLHIASLKEELLESELFGVKKGSFTGAIENKNGYFKEAKNGTLFIDEIGELSLEAQKKLLYALEEKKFTAVGDTVAQKLECRIILATNKNLKKLVAEKLFREDLYYRISSFQYELQPLRASEFKEDVILNCFEKVKKEFDKIPMKLSSDAIELLTNYSWPGNYRELKNVLEHLVVVNSKREITADNLPSEFKAIKNSNEVHHFNYFLNDYGEAIEAFEAEYLKFMLNKFDGRINETSRRIGISKSALIYKARKYRINTLKIKAEHREDQLDLAA